MRHTHAALTLALTAVLAGCTGATGTTAGPRTPDVEPASPQTLLASQTGTTTALPPVTLPVDDLTQLVRSTLPTEVGAAGRYTSQEVQQALDTLTRVVAATRLDLTHMCGPEDSNPVVQFASESFRDYLTDPANAEDRRGVQPTLTQLLGFDAPGCDGARTVGDGVLLGPHQWTPRPDGDGLAVDHIGRYTFLLAMRDGRPVPASVEFRTTYGLERVSSGWQVDSWKDAYWTTSSLRTDIPVPDGYLPEAPVPPGDPEAAQRVADAVATWEASPGATSVFFNRAADPIPSGGGRISQATSLERAAPRRGDAEQERLDGPRKGAVSYSADRGQVSYVLRDVSRRWTEVPFTGGDSGARWLRSSSDHDDGVGGFTTPSSGFTVMDVLEEVRSVVEQPCGAVPRPPSTPRAAAGSSAPEQCYVAVTANPLPDRDGPALLQATRTRGTPLQVFQLGLDAEGRLVRLYGAQEYRPYARPSNTVESWAWFEHSDTEPPPFPLPALQDTTPSHEVYVR